MKYSFISAKFLSEWMEEDYTGIILKAQSNKTPFMIACGCGKTTLTTAASSVEKCPHCKGKVLYVPIKRNDVVKRTTSIYEKVQTVVDAVGNVHFHDSHLLLKGTTNADVTELCLKKFDKPMYVYYKSTDMFSKSNSGSSKLGIIYSHTNVKGKTFIKALESLSSHSANVVTRLFRNNFYSLIDSFEKFTKVVVDYPALFTMNNIDKHFSFFVSLIKVLSDGIRSTSSLRPLAALTATSTMDDVFDLLGVTEKAKPYFNQMSFSEWNSNDRVKMFNDLVANKIPYSSYFMDLFNRDVLSVSVLERIYQTYKTILKKGEISVKIKSIKGEEDKVAKTIILPTSVAPLFLNFCKKFMNYQIDFTNVFIERYLNLESLGVFPTLDEMLNRAYFKRINQQRFSYNGKENFDDLFKQDPLEAIKYMK